MHKMNTLINMEYIDGNMELWKARALHIWRVWRKTERRLRPNMLLATNRQYLKTVT